MKKIFQTLTPSFSSSGWNPSYEPLSIIDKSWKTHPNIFSEISVFRLADFWIIYPHLVKRLDQFSKIRKITAQLTFQSDLKMITK